jgi:hypothetical protein
MLIKVSLHSKYLKDDILVQSLKESSFIFGVILAIERVMSTSACHHLPTPYEEKHRRCLSCGIVLENRRRLYCSMACRQKLKDGLNRRTGLLKALNIRYATFYFTSFVIVVDLLPYDCRQIFSFMLPRGNGKQPVDDYCTLSNFLGNAWWAEQKRTHKRYLASQHILNQAVKSISSPDTVIPLQRTRPAVKKSSLMALRLNKSDLRSSRLPQTIKQAYRRQAKKHHPDLGGDIHTFRKLHEAYEKLVEWSKNPTFIRSSGFPDKWLYQGDSNRWQQPNPRVLKR